MKNIKNKVLLAMAFVVSLVGLSGCSASENIQGVWNAQDPTGASMKIEIAEDKITFGDDESYEYEQVATGFENGLRYYGLNINGVVYTVILPDKDVDIALFVETSNPSSSEDYLKGTLLAAMSKGETPDYNDTAEEYFSF